MERFLKNLKDIISGKKQDAPIGDIPFENEQLFIDCYKVFNIQKKHGDLPMENLIICANSPTSMIKGIIDGLPYITFVYEFENGTGLVLSARKFNGHYVVTFFEASNSGYIKSIKKRGSLLFDKKKKP